MRENSVFKEAMQEILYNDPEFFRKNHLTSPYTILRDNGRLEEKGYFQKPPKRIETDE